MRIKKFLALVMVFGFFLVVNGTATGKQKKLVGTGGLVEGGYSALQSTPDGYCESSCCWASGCNTVCSESYCYAECGEDDTALYICNAEN